MKNILVSTPNWLGDVIFSTPVFQALKENYPGVRVTVFCVPRVKDVLTLCPSVDETIIYDEGGQGRPLFAKMALVAKLGQRHFDMVLVLRPSFSRSLMFALAGIPRRIGFASKSSAFLLSRALDMNGNDSLHRADVYLKLIEAENLKVTDRSSHLAIPEELHRRSAVLLNARGLKPKEPYAVLNTGGNWDLKQWPWESFAELAGRITREMGVRIVLPGSLKDVERVERIANRSGVSPVLVAGGTDLLELAAIMAGAEFVVSADSGPLHLAAAVGSRVVGIFGPTRAEITGPRSKGKVLIVQKDVGCNRAPCYYLECPDNRCMKAVSVADVFAAVKKIRD
jgi:lipopolysaccharide heptosyltransferase II